MRVQVDQDLCVSCGTCIDLCPDVFSWNEDEKAQATEEEIPEELENDAHEAVENCPTSAISEF
ncbi:MAG: ferredoxin [Armatimonadetes bacterium]|nr:ferredoxin [Armatimonadota bacterium]